MNEVADSGLIKLTNCDELTGLANCDELINYIKNNMLQHSEFSLLVLNVDHLNEINSKYGLSSGEFVLTSIAKMLSNCLHYCDQVFRFSKDKFAVILNNRGPFSVNHVTEQIKRLITDNSLLAEFGVSCTIGCACCRDNDNLNSLLQRAEQAIH
jgi:diguanylate cyclase (GGDEF)-like protein